MRCKNCGYVNEKGATRCIKCNEELHEAPNPYVPNNDDRRATMFNAAVLGTMMENGMTPPAHQPERPEMRTVLDAAARIDEGGERRRPQPQPHPATSTVLEGADGQEVPVPARPQPTPNKKVKPDFGGTVNPYSRVVVEDEPQTPRCTLTLLSDDGNEAAAEPIAIEGGEELFELTRDNTNPADNTISSHQAVLSHDEEGWHIKDASTYKTTAIVVTSRTKLKEGDIIVMGSSRFVFTEEQNK